MAEGMTPVSLYCAPDVVTFTATCEDLRAQQAVVFEASTAVAQQEVPFVICASGQSLTVLFGAPLDRSHSADELHQLAQGAIEFYQSELQNGPSRGNGSGGAP